MADSRRIEHRATPNGLLVALMHLPQLPISRLRLTQVRMESGARRKEIGLDASTCLCTGLARVDGQCTPTGTRDAGVTGTR